jgi:Uma2 family endonuclease
MVLRSVDPDRLYTADEFTELVGSDPSWELIEGKIEPVGAAAWDSSRVTNRLASYLTFFVETRGLGFVFVAEASFRLKQNPDSVVQPDVAYVRPHRLDGQTPGTYFAGTPELAVEVGSPSDRMAALTRKMTRYLVTGAELTWLVDPQTRQVHVRRPGEDVATILRGGDVLSGEDVVPGLALPLPAIFDVTDPIRPELVLPTR